MKRIGLVCKVLCCKCFWHVFSYVNVCLFRVDRLCFCSACIQSCFNIFLFISSCSVSVSHLDNPRKGDFYFDSVNIGWYWDSYRIWGIVRLGYSNKATLVLHSPRSIRLPRRIPRTINKSGLIWIIIFKHGGSLGTVYRARRLPVLYL